MKQHAMAALLALLAGCSPMTGVADIKARHRELYQAGRRAEAALSLGINAAEARALRIELAAALAITDDVVPSNEEICMVEAYKKALDPLTDAMVLVAARGNDDLLYVGGREERLIVEKYQLSPRYDRPLGNRSKALAGEAVADVLAIAQRALTEGRKAYLSLPAGSP